MPTLDSYTDPADPLNQLIHDRLSASRPGGTVTMLHVGGDPSFNGAILSNGNEYPFTALGTIGVRLATASEGEIINQIRNRYNPDTTGGSAAQLVLLDTGDQALIKQALRRDARHTRRDDPYAEQDVAAIAAHRNDPDVRWLLANKLAAQAHLNRSAPSGQANSRLVSLRSRNQPLFNAVYQWLVYGGNDPSPRVGHHEATGATRLRNHYRHLKKGLGTAQSLTEARGEYAASKILVTVLREQFQMKMGKGANGGRPNGIDQIWVRRDPLTGDVQEYLIVEAKGSINATLGHPSDGQQMSPRWLFARLLLMAQGTDGRFVEAGTNQHRMAAKILQAMFDDSKKIKVVGVVFHSFYGTTHEGQVVHMTNLGEYNQPEVVTAARNATPSFSGPPQSGFSLYTQ